MKKINTLMIGVGPAAIALLGVAGPANASLIVDTAASTLADRLVGPFQTKSSATGHSNRTNWIPNTSNAQVDAGAGAAVWSFPNVGDTGSIRSEDLDLCLTMPGNEFDPMELHRCDGQPDQQFSLGSDGLIQGQHGWYVSDGATIGSGPLISTSRIAGGDAIWFDVLSAVTAVVPVGLTGPQNGDVSDTRNPQFVGTGDEAAEITVRGSAGLELCRATVTNGVWDCTTTIDLPDGP